MPNTDFTVYDLLTGIPVKVGYADTDLLELLPGQGLLHYQIDLDTQRVDVQTGEIVVRTDNG
jgi:hypothetical protein